MKKKSKAKSIGSVTWSAEFEEVTSRKSKATTVDIATLRRSVIQSLGGSPCTNIALGIDPGLTQTTIAAIVSSNHVERNMFVVSAKTSADDGKDWRTRYLRVNFIGDVLKTVLDAIDVNQPERMCIVIEGYSFGSKGAVYTLAEVKQALLDRLYSFDPNFNLTYVLPPVTWRSCLCPGQKAEKGRAKEMIQANVLAKNPYTKQFGRDHNKYDAYGMALIALWLKRTNTVTSPSLDRLRKREGILP